MSNDGIGLIAERLREARKYMGLSQDFVAKHLGIPRSAVSLIESGSRRVRSDELVKLSSLYDRPVSYFTDNDSNEEDPATALLARNYKNLSENDRTELVQFAQFLASRKKTRTSE